jgi:hypothetical protein
VVERGKDFESIAGDVLRVNGGGGGIIFVVWVSINT